MICRLYYWKILYSEQSSLIFTLSCPAMNLLHCLDDTSPLLKQLKDIVSKNGKIYFTTLVKSNRWADKYLQVLADSGKLISRTVDNHKEIFKQVGLTAKYETMGNILSIQSKK